MDRHHELLQNEELYAQCGDMIKDNIVSIKKKISSLRDYLGDRRREVCKKLRETSEENEFVALDCTRQFYEHATGELVKIEQVCEKYLHGMKIDFLTAAKGRSQPPSYVSLAEVKRAYETCICRDTCAKLKPKEESCRCTWENIPKWCLEETRNILLRPKLSMPTEFDESDLKFKQDMTILRMKMFSLPKKGHESHKDPSIEFPNNDNPINTKLPSRKDFTDVMRTRQSFVTSRIKEELTRINSLKFVDGELTDCGAWNKILDAHGNQFGSKWHLVLRPHIETMIKKRRVPMIQLSPRATFDFLSSIRENGANFELTKEDLISLMKNKMDSVWLTSWRLQFQNIDAADTAATMIQKLWRGYRLRKRILESERRYIAASLIWCSWLALKRKRQLHERYLTKMLTSLHVTRELSLKLIHDFNRMIDEPHVVLHLPSLGYPPEIRGTLIPKMFAIHQNVTALRISFVRNPKSEVIYVLPVKPTEDLLTMYSDIIESVSQDEDLAKRITFVALSQADTFQHRSMNLSRVLHCSEQSLKEIRRIIAGKSAYFLPWIIDECDMRLAGNLGVALLSPDMELQRKFLNMSTITEIIDRIGLQQPVHCRDIKDYDTLCATLARLIVVHTEICSWLIKLNFGAKAKHHAVFLINHISVPFMPILRRERERHGDQWKVYPNLREEFLASLMEQLPKVVSSITQFSNAYKSWKEFMVQVQKFGCLLQAVPVEKNASTISVSLFLPAKATGDKIKWTGTADKIHLESTLSTFTYMIPQTTMEISKLEPVIDKFSKAMQNEGYFGYLTVDCYCYPDKHDDKLIVLILNVHPYYSYVQSYIDWMKFAIGGLYSPTTNTFSADIVVATEPRRRKASYLLPQRILKWNETPARFAIAISQLYHTRFSAYRWSELKTLFDGIGIAYNSTTKQGTHIVLHDSEVKHYSMMIAISSCMKTTLSMTHSNLKKLHRALAIKSKEKPRTNLPLIIDFFSKLSLDYENLSADPCK